MALVGLCPFCVHTTNEVVHQFAELRVIASTPENREGFALALAYRQRKAPLMHSRRLYFEDVLNIVSCFAVVALHSSLAVFSPARGIAWDRALVCQAVFIFAVPVFVMLSGANLMEYRKRYSTAQFFKRRVLRTGLALVVGSAVFYLIYYLAFRFFPDSYWGARDYTEAFSVGDFLDRLLTDRINDTYWFFYSIIGVYCVTPLLSLAAERKRLLEGLLAAGFVVAFLIPVLGWAKVLPPEYQQTLTDVPLLSSSMVFYFLLGYYLRRYVADTRGVRLAALVATVTSPVLMLLISQGANAGLPQYDSTPISEGFPLAATFAAGLFCLVRCLEPRLETLGPRARGVLTTLASTSLYVYLFHLVAIYWLSMNVPPQTIEFFQRHRVAEALLAFALTEAASLVIVLAKRWVKTRRARRRGSVACPEPSRP